MLCIYIYIYMFVLAITYHISYCIISMTYIVICIYTVLLCFTHVGISMHIHKSSCPLYILSIYSYIRVK